jgi:hypothetical protein
MGCAASTEAAFDAGRLSITNEPIPDRYESLGAWRLPVTRVLTCSSNDASLVAAVDSEELQEVLR